MGIQTQVDNIHLQAFPEHKHLWPLKESMKRQRTYLKLGLCMVIVM